MRLAQAAHRARTLPVHAVIAEAEQRHRDLASLLVAAQTEVSDVARQQQKADADVEQVRVRAARNQDRLDSGAVTSAKDLEALQHELQTLARRQSELEDVELEVMERLENAQRRADELSAERDQLEHEIAARIAERDTEIQVIEAERAAVLAERRDLAPGIPADLMELYVKLRDQHGGVGAARLHQRRCEGCRLEINATERQRLRAAAPDEVLRCEECRRILIRTAESGL